MLGKDLNDLVDYLNGSATLALRLADDLGVATLVGLDWYEYIRENNTKLRTKATARQEEQPSC